MYKITKNQNKFAMIMALIICLFIFTLFMSGITSAQEVPTPTEKDYTVLQTYNLVHLNGSTTKLELIKYSTTTRVLAWVERKNVTGDKIMRIAIFSNKKIGKKSTPIVELSTVLHEIVHLVEFQYIPEVSTAEQTEKRAYDYTNLVEQIFELHANKQIIINLPRIKNY